MKLVGSMVTSLVSGTRHRVLEDRGHELAVRTGHKRYAVRPRTEFKETAEHERRAEALKTARRVRHLVSVGKQEEAVSVGDSLAKLVIELFGDGR